MSSTRRYRVIPAVRSFITYTLPNVLYKTGRRLVIWNKVRLHTNDKKMRQMSRTGIAYIVNPNLLRTISTR